jgi:hypothetical protein
MRENRTSGSVRGVPGNGHSYRESQTQNPALMTATTMSVQMLVCIMVMKTGAASGRTDLETSSAVESGQGRASPARS